MNLDPLLLEILACPCERHEPVQPDEARSATRSGRFHRRARPRPPLLAPALEVGGHEIVLRRVVGVERGLGRARLGEDAVDAHRVQPFPVEEPARRIEDPLLDARFSRLPPGGAAPLPGHGP